MSSANLDRYLPIELLHEIYSYLCLPDYFFVPNRDPTIRQFPGESLSQVSSYWRAATLEYPALFCVADWMKWSLRRLLAWTDRGATAGLSVFVLFGGEGQEVPSEDRLGLLKSRSHLWRSLVIISSSHLPPRETISSLFTWRAPRLRSLTVHNSGRPLKIRNIPVDFAPSLRSIDLCDVLIQGGYPKCPLLDAATWASVLALPGNWKLFEAFSDARYLIVMGSSLSHRHPLPEWVVFPHLERLDMSFWDVGPFLNTIFERGVAPRLRILELDIQNAQDLENWGTIVRLTSHTAGSFILVGCLHSPTFIRRYITDVTYPHTGGPPRSTSPLSTHSLPPKRLPLQTDAITTFISAPCPPRTPSSHYRARRVQCK